MKSGKSGKCLVTQLCPTLCDPMNPIALQALLCMGFHRYEYQSGLPFPSPGNLPDTGIKPVSLLSLALALMTQTEWAVMKADPPVPVKSSGDCSFIWHFDFSFMVHPKPELSHYATTKFMVHRNCKIINAYCCFKLLNFEIICYTAIANTVFYNWT